ncbi:Tetraspanin family protein [Entamoeba marina]
MPSTVLLTTSILGFVLSCFFPIQFWISLLDVDVVFSGKLSLYYISIGCVCSAIFFLSTTIIGMSVKEEWKDMWSYWRNNSYYNSIGLLKMNSFEEHSSRLHNIERSSNCCGWKELIIEGCSAENITNSIQTCYEAVGQSFEQSFYDLFFFYIGYLIYVLVTLIVLIYSPCTEVKTNRVVSTEETTKEDDIADEKLKQD